MIENLARPNVFVMPCGAIFARIDSIKAEHIRTCAYCTGIQSRIGAHQCSWFSDQACACGEPRPELPPTNSQEES